MNPSICDDRDDDTEELIVLIRQIKSKDINTIKIEQKSSSKLLDLIDKKNFDKALEDVVVNEAMIASKTKIDIFRGKIIWGDIPLSRAFGCGAPDKLLKELIVQFPLAVKWKNGSGQLPIHYACIVGVKLCHVRKLLLLYPESIEIKCQRKATPLDLAKSKEITWRYHEKERRSIIVALEQGVDFWRKQQSILLDGKKKFDPPQAVFIPIQTSISDTQDLESKGETVPTEMVQPSEARTTPHDTNAPFVGNSSSHLQYSELFPNDETLITISEPHTPTATQAEIEQPSENLGLRLIQDIKQLSRLLLEDKEKEAKEKFKLCREQKYPKPNIFKLIESNDTIAELLTSPEHQFYLKLIEQANDFYKMVNKNLNKPKITVSNGAETSGKKPCIMDQTIREPATNTPYGHTAELKYLTWKLVKQLRVHSIALSGMFYGDTYTVEEQFLDLLYEREGSDAMIGGFVMCGPRKDDRKNALRVMKKYKIPNIFLDTTLKPPATIQNVTDALMEAIDEFHQLFREFDYAQPEMTKAGPVGHIYINFVDLMEAVRLKPTMNFKDNDDPKEFMENKDNVKHLEDMFQRIKKCNASNRVTTILFEEGKGLAQHTDYSCLTRWLRESFPFPSPEKKIHGYQILLHAHGGRGTEQAASLFGPHSSHKLPRLVTTLIFCTLTT